MQRPIEEFTIKFTPDELRVVAAALNELPYRMAKPLLESMQAQVTAQEKAAKGEDAPLIVPANVIPLPPREGKKEE